MDLVHYCSNWSSFLFPIIRYILEEIIIYKITGRHNYADRLLHTPYYIYDNSYFAIRIVLFSLVFYFVKNIWNTNKKMNELLMQKKQAEIQNLKNQLSPHFLFNTLNSFYADLMDTQPKIASDMLKLSEMLHYVTYENERDEVYVEDEIKFIQNYIDLFSRRYDNQLAIDFQVFDNQPKAKIASLLLIHFVENAFKHGLTTDYEKVMRITLKTDTTKLYFTVENHYIQSENYDEKGIGYKNIQQRLAFLYPNNHILSIHQTLDLYQVELQIPFST